MEKSIKKLVLIILFFSALKLSAIEDSCLALVWDDCPVFGWYNSCQVKTDTCIKDGCIIQNNVIL